MDIIPQEQLPRPLDTIPQDDLELGEGYEVEQVEEVEYAEVELGGEELPQILADDIEDMLGVGLELGENIAEAEEIALEIGGAVAEAIEVGAELTAGAIVGAVAGGLLSIGAMLGSFFGGKAPRRRGTSTSGTMVTSSRVWLATSSSAKFGVRWSWTSSTSTTNS